MPREDSEHLAHLPPSWGTDMSYRIKETNEMGAGDKCAVKCPSHRYILVIISILVVIQSLSPGRWPILRKL
jgi:hypothetical protein